MGHAERFAKGAAIRALTDAIATGGAVYDRFRRPLVEGAEVVVRNNVDLAFRVTSMVPDLSAPQPNMVKVVLNAEITLSLPVGAGINELIVVNYPPAVLGQPTVADQQQAAGNGAPSTAGPPPAAAPVDAAAADPLIENRPGDTPPDMLPVPPLVITDKD